MRPLYALPLLTLLYLAAPAQAVSPADTPATIARQCNSQVRCLCQRNEIIRHIPRPDLQSLLTQPPSEQRQQALATLAMQTFLSHATEINRYCDPVPTPTT